MKKFGIIVFIVAMLIGVVFANLFSFGKATGQLFSFSFLNSVRGSGTEATETRDVGKFNAIDVGGVFHVDVVTGKEFEVRIEADDNLIPFIKTEVNGGVLQISASERLKSRSPIRILISAPDIDGINASGVSRVTASGVKNDELRLDLSGASKAKVSGDTSSLTVNVSGASRVDAASLTAENVSVEASGASHVDVFVTGKLVSSASGASHIAYSGKPASVDKNTSGASKVYQK